MSKNISPLDDAVEAIKLFDSLIESWPSKRTLLLTCIISYVLNWFIFAGFINEKGPAALIFTCAITTIIIVLIWNVTNNRFSKDKINVALAVQHDDSEPTKKLLRDFSEKLKEKLERHAESKLHFAIMPQVLSKEIISNKDAINFAESHKIDVLLYGKIRPQKDATQSINVFDIHYLFKHRPIQNDASRDVAKEISEALPNRWLFEKEHNFFVTEFVAQHFEGVVHFILSIIAGLNQNFEDCEAHVQEAKKSLSTMPANPITNSLAKKLTLLEKDLYSAWATRYITNWQKTFDNFYLLEVEEKCGRLHAIDSNNYQANLASAISAFILRRDIKSAKRFIARCRKAQDNTWRYSNAFLFAYEGNLEFAHKEYIRAFAGINVESSVLAQCEEFIEQVLIQEPQASHLYFCLGFINYYGKKDYVIAKKDFQEFLEQTDPTKFSYGHKQVGIWLKTIDQRFT